MEVVKRSCPAARASCTVDRALPAGDLAHLIKDYWLVQWDTRARGPLVFENLPDPSPFVIFERPVSRLHTNVTSKHAQPLRGCGRLFGMTFAIGALYPIVRVPLSRLSNTVCGIDPIFQQDAAEVHKAVTGAATIDAMVARVERSLRENIPVRPDERSDLVRRIVEYIERNYHQTRVELIAGHFGLQKRTLERLFERYVGTTAKRIIRYHRVRHAAQRIRGDQIDMPRLALELGYCDQSHFINDFRSIVGTSPGEYGERVVA